MKKIIDLKFTKYNNIQIYLNFALWRNTNIIKDNIINKYNDDA